MLLLVTDRHAGDHPDPTWRLHTNLYELGGKASPHIFQKKSCSDLNLGESLCTVTFFLFSASGLNLLHGFYFYFDLFWMAWQWKPAVPGDTRRTARELPCRAPATRVGAKIESSKHKIVHIFHFFFLPTSLVFEIVNPFSRIFNAISSEKSCLISMPFLTC